MGFFVLLRKKLGVNNHMEKQNYLNQNNNNLEGSSDLSMENLLESFRAMEKERMSRRVSYARKNAVKQGKVMLGIAPYGYKMNNGTLYVEVEEANVVTMIFELLNQGKSFMGVSKVLNDQGILTKRGREWTSATVRKIAKSEVYAGDLFFNKTQIIYEEGNRKTIKNPRDKWIKVNVMPIVSKDLFKKVQDRFKSKSELGISNEQMNGNARYVDTNQCTALYIRNTGLVHEDTHQIIESNNIKVYEDKNFSGISDPFSRPALSALLEDVKNGNVKRVKVNSLSQISRKSEDIVKVINILKKNDAEMEVLNSIIFDN